MSHDGIRAPATSRALDVAIAEALGETSPAPRYSTEISWANVLVQKMEARGYTFHTPPAASGRSVVGFGKAPGQVPEVEVLRGDRALAVAQAAYQALRQLTPSTN